MKKFNNKSGFTLIEIIVVLIIVGILAAIALPNLFQNVQTSQGASALQTASSIEAPLESCLAKNSALTPTAGGIGACGLSTILSNGSSATVADAGSGFDIDITNGAGSAAGNNTLTYDLVGYTPASVVAFTLLRQTSGTFTCTPGAAPYTSVC